MTTPAIRPVLRAKDFFKFTGIPDSTRADWENPKSPRHDPTFPTKVRFGPRYVGYFVDDVVAWMNSRQEKKASVTEVQSEAKE